MRRSILALSNLALTLTLYATTASAAEVATLPPRENRFALLIGVEEYGDPAITPLRGPNKDVRALRDALIKYAGFPETQVIVLSSDQSPSILKPTRTNILSQLGFLLKTVPSDALLLIAFSGHGIEREGQAFLLTADTLLQNDIDLLQDTALSVAGLADRIAKKKITQAIVILDACRDDPYASKGSGDNLMSADFAAAFNFAQVNKDIQAFAILYATEVGHRSYISRADGLSFFSSACARALAGAAANERGVVTLGALVKYVEDEVPPLVHKQHPGKRQKPFQKTEGFRSSDLIIAEVSRATTPTRPDATGSRSDLAPVSKDVTFHDCATLTAKGVITQDLLNTSPAVQKAFDRWLCTTNFGTATQAQMAGIGFGVPVYGITIGPGITWTPEQRQNWQRQYCTSSKDSDAAAYAEVVAYASPDLFAAWNECRFTTVSCSLESLDASSAELKVGLNAPRGSIQARVNKLALSGAATDTNIEGVTFSSTAPLTVRVRHDGATSVAAVIETNRGSCSASLLPRKPVEPRFEERWSRTDNSGAAYKQEFKHLSENRHRRPDIIASGVDALADTRGRIYKVEYRCDGHTCGWSYHPAGGYGMDVTIAPDGKSFQWRRKWDGDPALETYIAYYEIPEKVCVEACAPQ